MTEEPATTEEFVAEWLAHCQVLWPEVRAKQLVGDLRTLTGDRIKFEREKLDAAENTRRAQYEICKRRGHQPTDTVRLGGLTPNTCKWCGTEYGTTMQQVENGAPT